MKRGEWKGRREGGREEEKRAEIAFVSKKIRAPLRLLQRLRCRARRRRATKKTLHEAGREGESTAHHARVTASLCQSLCHSRHPRPLPSSHFHFGQKSTTLLFTIPRRHAEDPIS